MWKRSEKTMTETKTTETKVSVAPEGVSSKERIALAAQQKNRLVAYARKMNAAQTGKGQKK